MQDTRLTLRLPPDDAAFLSALSRENRTSMNAEIIRSIRERKKAAGAEFGDRTPAAKTIQQDGQEAA